MIGVRDICFFSVNNMLCRMLMFTIQYAHIICQLCRFLAHSKVVPPPNIIIPHHHTSRHVIF